MADPTVIDVFKFVAVRPPQRVAEEDTQTIFIRDARAETPDGNRHLAELGRGLAKREAALRRWKAIDLSRLQPLADAHSKLVRRYALLGSNDPVPDVTTALSEIGITIDSQDQTKLTEAAWDALYTAYATGTDAGARLETPTAALRVLHVAALGGSPSSAADALGALRAKPLIPSAVVDSRDAGRETPSALVREERPAEGTAEMRSLLDELAAAQSLLDAAREAPALAVPELRETSEPEAEPTMETRRAGVRTISLSNIPRLRAVLPARLSSTQNHLLSNLSIGAETAVPMATRVLQDKVSSLTARAMSLRSNATFHSLVRDAAMTHAGIGLLGDLIGPFKPPPPAIGLGSSPDVDMTGRIRPLGIGDLKVVKQKLLAYLPGEVAHIENVLKGESKTRNFRVLDRLETTLMESEETIETTERDTQSTDRFELKKESEQTIKEDMSVQAGVTVSGSYGPVTMTAHGDFAYATSKEESAKSSANFGRDVVDRSVSKIQKTTKTERTTRTFHETEETNLHGINNVEGPGHVVGVYRWVDKKYRAQIYNYGRRLMLEFVVPEPSAFYTASQMGQGKPDIDAVEPAPFLDLANQPLTPKSFTPSSYLIFSSRYNAAGITSPPQEWVYVSAAFEQNSIENGKTLSKSVKDIVVPDGYRMYYYNAQVSALWDNYPHLSLQIGDNRHYLLKNTGALEGKDFEVGMPAASSGARPEGVLPVSVVGYDINAYAANVSALCSYMPSTYAKWQQDTYDKTYTAYKAMKTEYDQKMKEAQAQNMGISIEGRNPGMNRDIIARELKKHCLTMLTGMHFNNFQAMTDPADQPTHIPEIAPYTALEEGRFIQFFEQAFEWEQMTYLLYPYFWARKTRWIELFNQTDPDPAFMQFLQSGAARIVLPVSRAYIDAICYYLQSEKTVVAEKIWQGGEPPTIDDPLYISIADELRAQTDDLAGAVPEGDPWEFTIPTTLVWLQPDGTLPTFP